MSMAEIGFPGRGGVGGINSRPWQTRSGRSTFMGRSYPGSPRGVPSSDCRYIVSTGAPSMRRLVWLAMRCISFVRTRMSRSWIRPGRRMQSSVTSPNTAYGFDLRYVIGAALGTIFAPLTLTPSAASGASCTRKGVEVQVLGSGGPELEDRRASSSYLVLQDGRPRFLVDSGGGGALQFGRAGAHVSQLDAIFFSHLHIDHTADFAALIKSSYFEERNRPLPVYGPNGNDSFPPTTEFVADLFDAKHGAYRYLAGFLSGGEDGYNLVTHDVTLSEHEVRAIYRSPDTVVSATQVIHGGVPALAWRVE